VTTVAEPADVTDAAGSAQLAAKNKFIGESVPRREDYRFLTGSGTFTEDIVLPGMFCAAIVRSPFAHATIVGIDVTQARAHRGVAAVFTGADFPEEEAGPIPTDWTLPIMDGIPYRHLMARERVRYVGEPVAVVIAETRACADDAASLVEVEYDELPAVVDAESAVADGAPLVHDDYPQNTSYFWHVGAGEFDEIAENADHVFSIRLVNQRVHASSLEARVSLADYSAGTDTLTLYLGSQNVHVVRRNLALVLNMPEHRVRVVTPAVGGAFGSKLCLYPEDVIVSAASRRLRRPVRWVETRSEHFTGTSSGRDHVEYVTIAATREGKIEALRADSYANLGAYVSGMGAGIPAVSAMVFPGCYDFQTADINVYGVFTNTSTTETYRGAGRPEAAYLIERSMDELAVELGIDRVEIRRRNFIQPDQFPYGNASGMTYDSGDYETCMNRALELVRWDETVREQAEQRKRGRIVGIGLASYTEFCGFGDGPGTELIGFDRATWEQAVVAVTRTGKVIVQVGIDAAGQGHETSIAQIVATELGLPIEDVEVVQGDTATCHYGTGTFNSRSMSSAGSAAKIAAEKIKRKATGLAAHLIGVSADEVVCADGVFSADGESYTFGEISLASFRGTDLPEGMEPVLKEIGLFNPAAFTSPFGTHAAVVEIDPETGQVSVDRYVAVDDCGNIINPTIVAGQIHGGVAQGIGQALYEDLHWDEYGQPTGTSFMQYAIPRATHLPRMETDHTVTPSPVNPLGVKGVGESGAIGSSAAIVNAVMDALRSAGARYIDMPLTPAKVWAALQEVGR
jgi:carbon-monoxide dehydrogenase large subunit